MRKRASHVLLYLACMGIMLGMLTWFWFSIPPA